MIPRKGARNGCARRAAHTLIVFALSERSPPSSVDALPARAAPSAFALPGNHPFKFPCRARPITSPSIFNDVGNCPSPTPGVGASPLPGARRSGSRRECDHRHQHGSIHGRPLRHDLESHRRRGPQNCAAPENPRIASLSDAFQADRTSIARSTPRPTPRRVCTMSPASAPPVQPRSGSANVARHERT